MNSKGVFLTLMVFLVVVSVIVIFQKNFENQGIRQNVSIDDMALESINGPFEQIYFDVISLSKSGKERRVQSRGLPFDYNLADNFVTVRNTIPINSRRLSGFYDFLNSYTVFLKSQTVAEKGVHIDLNIDRSHISDAWRVGGYPEIKYVLIPQCILFKVNDGNNALPADVTEFSIKPGSVADGCAQDFNVRDTSFSSSWRDLNAVTVISLFPSNGYLGDTYCIGDLISYGLFCKHDPYNPADVRPYVEVFVESPDIPLRPVASGHFNPYNATTNQITIQFLAVTGWQSQTVDLWLGECAGAEECKTVSIVRTASLAGSNPGAVTITNTFSFRKSIRDFFLWGVDLNVTKDGFDFARYS